LFWEKTRQDQVKQSKTGLRSGRSASPKPDFAVSKSEKAGVLFVFLYAANKS
jgi:hypothetical protein